MPEQPKSATDFLLNGNTPTAKEPLNNSTDFLLNTFKNKQEFNAEFDKNPIPLKSDERYTLDPNKYETKYQSEFTDKVNSFWQGVDETQKSANDYDISAAKLRIAENNKLIKTLNPNDPKTLELLKENDKQNMFMQSATEDKIANQKEIDDEYVSKKYKLNQALVQGQGSEAGFFDKMAYTMPNMIGSSVSLVVPNLITTFGTKAGATLATAALAKAGVKGGKSGWMGTAIALTGALGGIALGRHLESKSEVGGQITANEDKLTQDYIDKVYNETGQEITKDQIPQDDMDDIVIQSNKGREELYWKNMALAIPDMGEALLFSPKLNLPGVKSISKAVNKVVDYNKVTRLGTKAAKLGLVYESEKFEEGAQYAFGKRQEDFALNSGEYEDKGFIKNLLTDSEDVLTSMNWSPIGEVRGSGRYSENKEFQTAEESGGMLAAVMGGIQTVGRVAKDLNTYRKVNKELQADGIFNVDDKYFKLKDQILQKHFENETTHHLLEGVKNLIGKKNEDGTEILTQEDAKQEIDKVQKAFDTYQTVNSQVNEIEKKGAFLMFDSAQQKAAKKAVKDNLFHTSLQLNREQKELGELSMKREGILNTINDPKLKEYNNISDLIEKQTTLLDGLKNFDPIGIKESYNIPFRIKANETKLKNLEALKKAEETRLTEAGIDIKVEPLTLAEQELNKQITAKSSLLDEQTNKYKELLAIKDDKTLQDWYSKHTNKIKNEEEVNAQIAKDENTKENAVNDFSEFEDKENTPAEGSTWYDSNTTVEDLTKILQEAVKNNDLSEEEAGVIFSKWDSEINSKKNNPFAIEEVAPTFETRKKLESDPNFEKSLEDQRVKKQQELDEVFGNTKKLSEVTEGQTVIYKGEKYILVKHPTENVFQLESLSSNKVIDIPLDEEFGYDAPLYYYGIAEVIDNPITDLIDVRSTGLGTQVIEVDGKTYLNMFSNPLSAINYDKNGNIISVTLNSYDKNKTPRTFKKYAQEIAYAILLETYNKLNNENQQTRTRLATAIKEKTSEDDSQRKEQNTSRGNSEESQQIEKDLAEKEAILKKEAIEIQNYNELIDIALLSKTKEELLGYSEELKKNKYYNNKDAKKLNDLYKTLNEESKNRSTTDWFNIIGNATENELKAIYNQIDAQNLITPDLITAISKRRSVLQNKDLSENEIIEKLANGVTNASDDNLNTDEVLESNNTSNETSNKEFVSKKPNALMMKFYDFVSGTKKWARHTKKELLGYVMEASSAEVSIDESNIQVSIDVNSPTVAIEGSEVAYVHNGKDIALVDANGKIVGFIGLGTNIPGPKATQDVIAAHKELLAIREYVLSQPSGTIKTTILAKGHGKLLTKMVGNSPVLDESISQRAEDMVDGKPLFLYDNGVGLVSKNLNEEQAKVAKEFENISFVNAEGVGEGRIYQAVKTANGTWFVIPVYTRLIGETNNASKVIDTIISILKGAIVDGKTIDYDKALQQLNKYIFATNTSNYKNNVQTLRIYEDKDHKQDGTISVGGFKLTFNDIQTDNKIDDFKKALGTVRHNISVNELGVLEEDSRLINDNVLVTNAYTDSTGQYYVQPYIEVNDPQGYVKPEVKAEPLTATTATNISSVETTTTSTDKQELDRLRLEEQAKYDAMTNPNDAVARKKIYDAYDAVITPVLNRIKTDIAERRKEAIEGAGLARTGSTGKYVGYYQRENGSDTSVYKNDLEELKAYLNAKYDAELAALDVKPTETTKQEIVLIATPKHDISKIDVTGDDFAESRTNLGGQAVNRASLEALNKILPGLTVANAKLAEEVGNTMKDTYGMFHNMLIYLFNGATNRTLFHEAFHGVFRNILSDEERRAVLDEAIKKYDKPNAARLQFLREGKGNANLSNEILTQLHYEERLADDFGKYADGEFNNSLGQRIINFFKKVVDLFNIFKNANTDQINDLFEALTKGKFAKRSIDAKLANKAIDLNDFGGAYKRVLNTDNLNIPISVELERTNSIANQILDGIAKELAKGIPMSKVNINEIANKIKAQYKLVFDTENAKSKEEFNPQVYKISYAVNLKFKEILENVKKQITLTRKLNFKGDFIDTTEIEGSEDTTTDSENVTDMQGNESKGFQEQTVISGIRSATQDIKLFLSNVPVTDKQGVVQIDSYGFTIFHSYEKLYYKLETSLIGTTSFVEQLKIMRALAPYSTEIQQIIDAIENITDPQIAKNFKQQFAANFNKAVLDYKLVTYSKKGNAFEFKMLNPNRKDVALNLKTKWETTNITDPTNLATNDIRTFNEKDAIYEVSKNKVSALLDSYWAKGEQTKNGKILTPKLTLDEVYELAQKLGISLSYDSIELYASLEETNLVSLTNDLLSFGKFMYVDAKFKPARTLLSKLIQLETNAQTELFTSSFNNVEQSVVYAVQHQSFASKLVKALNSNTEASSALVKDLQRDPMNVNNIILLNKSKLEMFALDGLKMQGDNITGKKFNKIHKDDYLAMIINMYDNPTAKGGKTTEEVAVYAPIIPAEKGLSFGFTGTKISVNKIDGKIPADSQIVEKFKQLFFNELARIRQVMIDINTLPTEKLINNVHLGKELGLRFNLPNAINPKLKSKLDALLKTTLDQTLAKGTNPSAYIEGYLSNENNKNLMDEVTASIVNNLENITKTHIDLALKSDVIQIKDGVLVSDKLATTDVEKLIREWALNSTLFNVSQSLLINGDPAFYKGAEDNGKRFYQGFSMLKYADTTTIDDSYKYLKGGKMKINVIADVKESTRSTQDLADIAKDNNLPKVQELANDHYNQKEKNGKIVNPLNATDAQLFMSVGAYAEIKRLFGISSKELTEGFTNADLADALNEVPKSQQGILDVLKPFFYGVQWNEEYQRYTPIQVKCSIFPLSNKYVANNPLLAEHKALMDADENYPQVIAFESSMKAMLPNRANIENTGETSIVELDLNNFGEQVANPDHMLDSSNSSLRQMKMLMYGMVQEKNDNGEDVMYGNKTGRQLKDEIAELDKANIEEALGKVVNAFEGNNKEFNEFIQGAITSRNSTSIIEAVFEQKPDGTFSYPLDLINSKATIQLISSIFTKRVVRQEFKGGAAVQVSSVGLQIAPKQSDYKTAKEFQEAVDASPELSKLQTSLNWVRKGEIDPKTGKVSSIDFIEAYAPAHAREFINKDGSFKDNIPDELKQMLIYRIPYEGAHSSMVIRVVGFLPAEYKGAILLPYEVTQQFGADFDFDKIYFIVKDFTMSKDGEFKIYKYIDGNTEQDIINRYQEYIAYTLKNNKEIRELLKIEENAAKESGFYLSNAGKVNELVQQGLVPHISEFSKLSVVDQNIKPARDNKILDNYMQILRSVNMLESLITPSGAGAIADVYENVEESQDNGNYFTPGHQVYLKDLFHKISMLKGVSALQVTGHAWATEGNLEIKPVTVTKDGEVTVIERGIKVFKGNNETELKNNLSKIISDSGNKIVEELSSMMAVILDAVKFPNQLPSIGISMKTLPIWAYIVRLGFGSRVASQFTSQQAIKDLSIALENNDKQLKSKTFVKQDVNTVRAEYIQKYQEAYDAIYEENKPNEGSSINSRKIVEYLERNDSEKVGNYNILSLENLEKYTTLDPEELAKKKLGEPYKSLSQQNEELTGIEKLKYLQLQIVTLNIFKDSSDVIGEISELNQLFSFNKETGPNFEDVNGKKASYNSLVSNNTLISGIDKLLHTDAIKPYVDTINAQFEIMGKHYNFASPFFNNIKDSLAKMQYGEKANLTRIPAEDRETINGFIQMFLDAEETFDNIYTDENRIPEEDFINDLKVLLSKKISTSYKYKIFGDKVLSSKAQEQLKATTLLKSLEVVSIKDSDQNYIALKGNRYELAQKEMMIDELIRLYNSQYKQLAVRLIEQAFKDNGFFSGLHSYSGLIHPSILQNMGLTEGRDKIRKMVQAESTNVGRIKRIINQLVRNNIKKFTRVYDNNQKLFIELDGGKTLIVDMNSKDSRLKTELNRPGKENKHPMYIRYILNDKFTPAYELDEETTEESGQITYRQTSLLGSPAKKMEINTNSDEVETKFPNNKYEQFVAKNKTTTTGGMSKTDLAAEFGEDETISVPEVAEVETESDTENITDGQAEIKPEGSILSAEDLANEWGDEEFEEDTTQPSTSVESKELTQEEADWLANNIKLITRTYKVFSIHDAIDTELKNPIIIGETKVTNIDPDVSEKPYIIFERPSGRWMVKIEEKKGNLFTRLYKWADLNKKGEFSFYVSENSSDNDKINIEKAGLNPLIQQLYTDTNIKDPGTRLGQFEAANALQQKYNIKRTFKDIINELKNNISPSQEKSVSSTIINPEITKNKPDGLPGIDRSNKTCS
jgi:hypothetical protein